MYIYAYLCKHMYVCMYVCMYVWICINIYGNICVNIRICIYYSMYLYFLCCRDVSSLSFLYIYRSPLQRSSKLRKRKVRAADQRAWALKPSGVYHRLLLRIYIYIQICVFLIYIYIFILCMHISHETVSAYLGFICHSFIFQKMFLVLL